jgi:hypothetical protein
MSRHRKSKAKTNLPGDVEVIITPAAENNTPPNPGNWVATVVCKATGIKRRLFAMNAEQLANNLRNTESRYKDYPRAVEQALSALVPSYYDYRAAILAIFHTMDDRGYMIEMHLVAEVASYLEKKFSPVSRPIIDVEIKKMLAACELDSIRVWGAWTGIKNALTAYALASGRETVIDQPNIDE